MSTVAPKVFQHTDSGAPPCDGQVGSLIEILSSCLVVRKAVSAVSGASFVDCTTESRLLAGTAVTPFVGPATTNEFYIGMCRPFEQVQILLSTLGVGGTYTWQYWNGSAWTTFSPTDGTAGFVQNGTVSWLVSARTGWVANAVNGSTIYWVRVLMASTPSVNPLIGSLTVTGWNESYTGTNLRSYQMGGSTLFFLDVNDAGPGAGGAREARLRGYETMSAIGVGTNPFPIVVQETNGMIIRKSTAASATTRSWALVCDDRTFYLYTIPGDSNNYYSGFAFGDFYSFLQNDPYRCMIIGRQSSFENSTVGTNQNTLNQLDIGYQTANPATNGNKYFARPYTGIVGSVLLGMLSSLPFLGGQLSATNTALTSGSLSYPNEIDGGIYTAPIWLFEGSLGTRQRGRLRGFWHWGHAYNAVLDRTTFVGTGETAGRTFILLTNTPGNSANGATLLETSDTWETN